MARKETLSAAQAGRSAESAGAEESVHQARKEKVAEAADEVELLSGSPQSVDSISEASLRPRSLDAFVGQTELKSHLKVMLGAACQRQEPVDHLLLAGPPGLGKTTMAHIVANELKVECQVTSGPALERTGDLAAMLTKLSEGAVLFIDEIHRLPRPVEEVLYPAMEDFRIDIVLGKGPAARSISLELTPFTLVGATTRTGLITGPLRDRFGLVARFDLYNHEDLTQIVKRTAAILNVPVTANGAAEIARRARGTPRIANRLLRQVRDFAEMHRDGYVNAQVAADGLAFFSVDQLGLDRPSRAVLEALCTKFRGGPVGRSTLAIAVSEPVETLEDVYEPFLIQQGLLIRTPRGRVATKASWVHLGLDPPADVSDRHPELFR